MLNKKIAGILAACALCAGPALNAQQNPAEKPKDAPAPTDQKPKGPEKLLIYNGENFKAQLYGFIRMDMIYNTADVTNESAPLAVENQRILIAYPLPATIAAATPTNNMPFFIPVKKFPSQNDGSLIFDLRHTRLGLKVSGPEVLSGNSSALLEFDFWGQTPASGTALRQGMIRMRHAYGRIDWKSGTSLQIGQWWSAAMAPPSLPITLTFIPFGNSGNIFMREPNILLGQKLGNDKANILFEYSLSTVQGGNDAGTGTLYPGSYDTGLVDRGPGEASKQPGHRGRITGTIKPNDQFGITLGAAGHYQKEKHAKNFANALSLLQTGGVISAAQNTALTAFLGNRIGGNVSSASAGIFWKIDASFVSWIGHGWTGYNMDTFLVSIGQAVATSYQGTKILPIPVRGGYTQLQFDLNKVTVPLRIAIGYGGVLKSNKTYVYSGHMLWNQTIHGTLIWDMAKHFNVGLEIAQHQSKYKRILGVSEDWRYQVQMNFIF
jgi:hypothetical protein